MSHELKITIKDEEFSPLIRRELMWHRDHIVESGDDYDRNKRRREALVKAFGLVIGYYSPR